MAVTRIWEVRGRIEQPIEYIKNPEKNPVPVEKELESNNE